MYKKCIFLVSLTILVVAPAITTQVDAADPVYDWDFSVPAMTDYAWFLQGTMKEGTTFYGEITVTSEDCWVYVLDSTDYQVTWNVANAVFSLGEFIGFREFEFQVPYDDSYYFIFGNKDSLWNSATVSGWVSYDNTAPSISLNFPTSFYYDEAKTVSYTFTDNFGLKEMAVVIDYGTETWSPISGPTYSWSGSVTWVDSSSSQYYLSPGYHTLTFKVRDIRDLLTTRSVTIWVGYRPSATTTSPTTSPTSTTSGGGDNPAPLGISPIIPIGLGLIGLAVAIGVVFGVKGKGKGSPPSPAILSPGQEPPSDDIAESYSVSKETVTPVQVVCPFCGARTQAGVDKCQICGSEL